MKSTYGKLTVEQLRTFLTWLPILEHEKAEFEQLIDTNPAKFRRLFYRVSWTDLYEMPFINSLAVSVINMGLSEHVSQMAKEENPTGSFIEQGFNVPSSIDFDSLSEEETASTFNKLLPIIYSSYFSMKSLMVYGLYLNDLISIAKNGEDEIEADKALLRAIKVDPSVVSSSTANLRISKAIVMSDIKFMTKLKNALNGKLGKREAKNYQQMRLILQVMLETKAENLSDKDLSDLFVHQLDLCTDGQGSAEKNISEFTRNFMKLKKSTI